MTIMSQPIHLKIKIDPQPMEKWDKDPDLNNWEGEGGALNPKILNGLPDDSPVQKGDLLKVTDGQIILDDDEYFYDITVEKQTN